MFGVKNRAFFNEGFYSTSSNISKRNFVSLGIFAGQFSTVNSPTITPSGMNMREVQPVRLRSPSTSSPSGKDVRDVQPVRSRCPSIFKSSGKDVREVQPVR